MLANVASTLPGHRSGTVFEWQLTRVWFDHIRGTCQEHSKERTVWFFTMLKPDFMFVALSFFNPFKDLLSFTLRGLHDVGVFIVLKVTCSARESHSCHGDASLSAKRLDPQPKPVRVSHQNWNNSSLDSTVSNLVARISKIAYNHSAGEGGLVCQRQ